MARTSWGNPCDAEQGGNNEGEPPAPEELALMADSSKTRDPPAGGWKAALKKKKKIVWAVVVNNVIWFLIVTAVITSLWNNSSAPLPSFLSCPSGWPGYEGKCYFFSEEERVWNSSQSHCSSVGAALVKIQTQEEWDFLMRYKKHAEHWIGLKRENNTQPWKWADGSPFNSSLFRVGANGECAYLNDEKASSTWCDTQRNWICSKPLNTY